MPTFAAVVLADEYHIALRRAVVFSAARHFWKKEQNRAFCWHFVAH